MFEFSFEVFKVFFFNIVVKLIVFVLLWVFFYYFCVGICYLLMDVNYDVVMKEGGKWMVVVVFVVLIVLMIVMVFKLFGVF